MNFSEIKPFLRYVHYLPLDDNCSYNEVIPYDNRCFFTCRGKGQIKIGAQVYPMREGDLLLIPSGVAYHILTPQKQVTYLAVNFDYTQNFGNQTKPIPPIEAVWYNPKFRLESPEFSDSSALNGVLYLEKMHALLGKFLILEREYTKKLFHYEESISGIFLQILVECLRAIQHQKFTKSSETVDAILGLIHEQYFRPLSNHTIAEVFHLHPNYISSLIKNFTGMPLHQYLMRVRISKSVELLEEGRLSVGEIAQECGFCDIYHYSKVFRNIMGISPSGYYK